MPALTADGAAGNRLFGMTALVTALIVLKAVLALVATVILTRALGPAGRGTVTFVITVAGMVAWVPSSGVSSALTSMKATGMAGHAQLAGRAVGASAVTGGLAAAFWLGLIVLGQEPFDDLSLHDVIFGAVLVVALVAVNNLGHLAALEGRAVMYQAVTVAGSAAFLLVVTWSAAVGQLTASLAVAAWTTVAVVTVLVLGATARPTQLWVELRGTGRLVAASVRSNVAGAALFAIWRLDVVFVKALRGSVELGVYAVAVSLAETLLLMATAVRVAFQVRQGRSDGRKELAAEIARATRLTGVVMVVAALGVGVVSLLAVPLVFGPEFAGAIPVLLLLLPGLVALGLYGPLFDYLYAEGRAGPVIWATVGALAANIALNLALLPVGGVAVASLASTFAYVMIASVAVSHFAKVTGCSVSSILLLRGSDLLGLRTVLERRGLWPTGRRRPRGPSRAGPRPEHPTVPT